MTYNIRVHVLPHSVVYWNVNNRTTVVYFTNIEFTYINCKEYRVWYLILVANLIIINIFILMICNVCSLTRPCKSQYKILNIF